MVEFAISRHARLALQRRKITRSMVARVFTTPTQIKKGKGAEVELHVGQIEGKPAPLVVVCNPRPRRRLVITAYWQAPKPLSCEN